MANKLKNTHHVRLALEQKDQKTGYGADGGDIFADFLPSTLNKKESKKEQDAKEAEVPKLEVDLRLILN